MELSLKKRLNPSNLYRVLIFLFIFSLFFPIRHVFFGSQAYKLGEFSDFTAFSLYLNDVFLVLLAIYTVYWHKTEFFRHIWSLRYLVVWLYIVLAVNLNPKDFTPLYFAVKWLELVVAYGTVATLTQEKELKDWVLKVFVGCASFQAIITIWQFLIQGFIGLNKLGEQLLSPRQVGFAKMIADGIPYVRGYGTFPHPNPLSAFLAVSVLIIVYLLSQVNNKKQKLLYSSLLFINIAGLTATFSRAAVLATLISAGIYFGTLFIKNRFTAQTRGAVIVFVACIVAQLIIFRPFLLTRVTVSDSASLERIFYAKVGLQMIKDNPLFGVGIGESVLHMQQYSSIHLEPWEIQPVHNYFLLAATELGVIGALILIWIFLSHLIKLLKHELTADSLLLTAILIAFLLLMVFDHYFYTLQQTQLLLWVTLGLIRAQKSYAI